MGGGKAKQQRDTLNRATENKTTSTAIHANCLSKEMLWHDS